MSVISYVRGHKVVYDEEEKVWFYEEDGVNVSDVPEKPCINCGEKATLTGADYCLKDLENCDFIIAACCGHGIPGKGYIMLVDGRLFKEAVVEDDL